MAYRSSGVDLALYQAAAGDANGDGAFNQLDIVHVLQAAKYRTSQVANWLEGDWDGNGRFDQFDIIAAQQTGRFLAPGG